MSGVSKKFCSIIFNFVFVVFRFDYRFGDDVVVVIGNVFKVKIFLVDFFLNFQHSYMDRQVILNFSIESSPSVL